MILLIDNYDSFTYNVKQVIETLGVRCEVVRNDQITLGGIESLAPRAIVISPGPGRPEDAGITVPVLQKFRGIIPVFGICLGHQAIGLAGGAKVVRARRPMHGKVSRIRHESVGVFDGLPAELQVARYHSLVIDESTLTPGLEITARSDDGEIMGVRNAEALQEGVQFHPESIATESGREMIANFLKRVSG
jgi:anthranilate synthase/aminodeoxychorismate synthase-like glutamine amidotransferase